MTTPIFKLTKGVRYIDLQAGRYRVHQGWAPPSAAILPLLAEGTSANRNGAALAGRRPVTRSFSLRVNVTGSTDAEIRRGVNDIDAMLALAGDDLEPLYLEFKPNSDTPEPLWGNYGVNLRYEIVSGSVEVEKSYLAGARLANDVDVIISVTVKPYAVGKPQRPLSCSGAVRDDILGVSGAAARGLAIERALTNKMTNPVFGHSTWNNGWTADASLTATKNESAYYLMPGAFASALLTSASTGQEFYQSINAGNTATHVFVAVVMLPSGGLPSSSDMQLYYNTTLTTTFTEIGNGMYLATASAAGINAATNTGVQVKNGRTIYLLYMGMCETDEGVFYPFWGDNIGCSWSSTPHASTNSQTVGIAELNVEAQAWNNVEGSLMIAFRPHWASTDVPGGEYYLLGSGGGGKAVYYTGATDGFFIEDGTNIVGAASAFSAMTPVIVHATWSSTALTIYVNGVQLATGSHTIAAATQLYLGYHPTLQGFPGTYLGFSTWGEALTAAEVAADYANIASVIADGQGIGTIPWLWTKDGDDVVDNADDSTRDNWCVVGGIPGSADAETTLHLDCSQDFYSTGPRYVLLSNWALTLDEGARAADIAGTLYHDLSGTVDANSSGGAYQSQSNSTTAVGWSGHDLNMREALLFAGREIGVWGRVDDNSTSLLIAMSLAYGVANAIYSDYKTVDTSGFQIVSTPFVVAPDIGRMLALKGALSFGSASGVYLYSKLSTGTGNVYVDFYQVITRPFVRLRSTITGGTANGGLLYFSRTNELYNIDGGTTLGTDEMDVTGDTFELSPERLNMILHAVSGGGASSSTIATTLTYLRLEVRPRYALL